MKKLFLIILGICGLWDGFTTFYGTQKVLEGDDLSASGGMVAVSAAFALIITGCMFSAKTILQMDRDQFFGKFMMAVFAIAACYDLFTSFIGNREFLVGGNPSVEQHVVLFGITALVSGSPVIFSFMKDEVEGGK